MAEKQSADRWNERYVRGTKVRVISYGVEVETITASHAQQWGDPNYVDRKKIRRAANTK